MALFLNGISLLSNNKEVILNNQKKHRLLITLNHPAV